MSQHWIVHSVNTNIMVILINRYESLNLFISIHWLTKHSGKNYKKKMRPPLMQLTSNLAPHLFVYVTGYLQSLTLCQNRWKRDKRIEILWFSRCKYTGLVYYKSCRNNVNWNWDHFYFSFSFCHLSFPSVLPLGVDQVFFCWVNFPSVEVLWTFLIPYSRKPMLSPLPVLAEQSCLWQVADSSAQLKQG